MKRFLVLQTAFTGDVILSTALLEDLHRQFPEARIDVAVRKGNEALFAGHPFVHHVLVWDKKRDKLKNLLGLLKSIRKEHYDHVINLQRFLASGLLTVFSGGKETIGFDKNPLSFLFDRKVPHVIGDGRHETERNRELIRHLIHGTASKPHLYPAPDDLSPIEKFTQTPYFCIAPGSVWFTKTWPEHKWLELTHSLLSSHKAERIYLLGSPAESTLCERIAAGSDATRVINIAGKLSLLQSAALMKGAAMNYVNDSAPLHLASAMDAPVTAIYCSTIPAFGFGPLSAVSRIIETGERLDCRPCGLHGFRHCPKGHFRCAESISIDRVLAD